MEKYNLIKYINLKLKENQGIFYLDKEEIKPRSFKEINEINELYHLYSNDLTNFIQESTAKVTISTIRSIIFDTFEEQTGYRVFRSENLICYQNIDFIFLRSVNDFLMHNSKHYDENESKNIINLYRGHSNLNYKITPSIFRKDLVRHENNLYHDLKIRNPKQFEKSKSTFEDLSIMQHHGLPTRLLDVTINPLVALYFAVQNKNTFSPAELIRFKVASNEMKFYNSDTVTLISNISKMDKSFMVNQNESKANFNTSRKGIKLLHYIKDDKPYFKDEIVPQDLYKNLVVKPIQNTPRLSRQSGLFILFGLKNSKRKFNEITTKSNNGIALSSTRYIIPSKSKKNILKELEILGISENELFPEIDNGAKFLRDKYDSKP
jgi:hypothetical protein